MESLHEEEGRVDRSDDHFHQKKNPESGTFMRLDNIGKSSGKKTRIEAEGLNVRLRKALQLSGVEFTQCQTDQVSPKS
jgi:hypothetical protein